MRTNLTKLRSIDLADLTGHEFFKLPGSGEWRLRLEFTERIEAVAVADIHGDGWAALEALGIDISIREESTT